MKKPLKVLSLFGGIECGHMALDNIKGVEIESYHSSEFDKYPIALSSHNFPDIVHIGDVTKIDGSEFEGIDLLIGGPPCQDLSIAGARKGLTGERSGKFYDYVRILRNSKPKAFLCENVASMNKEARDEITKELYGIEPVLINSNLLSAQNRKRLYWVGIRNEDGTYRQAKIEQPTDRKIVLRDILEEIPFDDPKWKPLDPKYVHKIKEKEKAYAVTATYAGACPQDHIRSNRTVVVRIPEATKKGYVELEPGDCVDMSQPNSTTRRGRGMKEKSNTLMTGNEFYLLGEFRQRKDEPLRIHADQEKSPTLRSAMGTGGNNVPVIIAGEPKYVWRKLTVRECARLQTIPEDYDFSVLSDSRAYKGIGNGWTVNVIEHIFRSILDHLK